MLEGLRIVGPARLIEDVGVNNILVETDLSHPTCIYAGGKDRTAKIMAGLDPHARRRIRQDNAVDAYQFSSRWGDFMTAIPYLVEPPAPRILPPMTDDNRSFWSGGATGQLLIPRCQNCQRWSSPFAAACTACGGSVVSEAVSGRATVFTYTLNSHQFHPDVPPPNLIAIVVLDEQDDLRLATNLVHCEEEEVHIGMPVSVLFEQHGEVYYPVFAPAAAQ